MASKSKVSKISNGGRQKANVAHEAKRQAKFAKKREEGRAYEYKPITAKKGSSEWVTESNARKIKNQSKRTEIARLETLFARLDNMLKAQEEKKKAQASNK